MPISIYLISDWDEYAGWAFELQTIPCSFATSVDFHAYLQNFKIPKLPLISAVIVFYFHFRWVLVDACFPPCGSSPGIMMDITIDMVMILGEGLA